MVGFVWRWPAINSTEAWLLSRRPEPAACLELDSTLISVPHANTTNKFWNLIPGSKAQKVSKHKVSTNPECRRKSLFILGGGKSTAGSKRLPASEVEHREVSGIGFTDLFE